MLLTVAGDATSSGFSIAVASSTIPAIVNSADTFFDPVTDDVRQVFQIINYVTLCSIISFFGIGANIANIAVFFNQGFKDSINISLLGLAIADFACSISMFWTSICYNPLFQNVGLPIVPLDVMYVTGGWPHVCFNRVTSFIIAFITLERCLCIAMPLKVKRIITPFRTKVINVSIFISMIILFSPFYFVNKLEWGYSLTRNRSILGITFTKDREIVDSVTFFIHSVFLSSVFLFSVAICTIILVVKLNKKTKWRNASLAQITSKPETASVKDKKVVKMITLISVIFIICYVPPTFNFLIMACNPEFSITGRLQNMFFVSWSVSFSLQAFNSSVNIFVYFKMSSKFKITLYYLFCRLFKSNERLQQSNTT